MTKMTLAEAIREGAKLGPQITGFRHDSAHGSCVLGAVENALINNGQLKPDVRMTCAAESIYPELKTFFKGRFPCRKKHPHARPTDDLNWAMAVLNNECGWTREEIADWVEKLLPAKPALPVKS